MKIRQIIAKNMTEALAKIKAELGDNAIIISNEPISGGEISVTAAIDEEEDFSFDEQEQTEVFSYQPEIDDRHLRDCLSYHGVLENVSDKIMATYRQISKEQHLSNEKSALEKTLSKLYAFSDVLDKTQPIKLFVGTSGSGKSTAIAKTATQAKFKHLSSCIISTDNVRAGANKQLEAFAKILDVDFSFCADEKSLYRKLGEQKEKYDFVLIDTPGINPFIDKEVERVAAYCDSAKAQKILTLDAGRNTIEAVEIAEIFASIGANYLLPTRLDLTRRIGTVLSVAACCDMAFYAAGVNSSIANGLAAIDSQSLTKLILS